MDIESILKTIRAAITPPESCWFTAAEAAEHMRVSYAQFTTISKARDFPAPSYPNRQPRWLRKDLDDWMKRHKSKRAA